MDVKKEVPENLHNARIDLILKELKFVDSRNKAISLIITGKVYADNEKILKPGKLIKCKTTIKLKKRSYEWVSRGGIKLDNAIKTLDLDFMGLVGIDVGCSTGGFTDVMLNRGVRKVYAIDVGYGQFDWKLRNSDKVELLERTNAKFVNKEMIPELVDLVVCDVSFISIKKIMLPIKNLLKKKFQIISLIKPQFELQKKDIGKGGIVKDSSLHQRVCEDINLWFRENFNYKEIKIIESSILGQKGNKEFFIYLKH